MARPEKPWTLNSWGFNVLAGGAYRMGGLPGVALVCAALSAAAFWLALVLARRLGASAAVAGSSLHRLAAGGSAVWILPAIGLLSVVWVNLHAAVLLGIAVIGATTVLVFLKKRSRPRTGWFVGALATAGACALANPYGIHLLDQTMQGPVVLRWSGHRVGTH